MSAASSSAKLLHGFPTPGPQDPTGQQVMDHVFFLSNEQWKKAREQNEYDYVIIGTGFCGFAFSQRAMERNADQRKPCRILMIERGPFFLPEHFQNLPLPYKNTLGGLSETFPWTLSAVTAQGKDGGYIRWQHGMVPFFGGRSTLWSAWCPTPNRDEMLGWPEETISAAESQFAAALKLLRVKSADQIDREVTGEQLSLIRVSRPVYGPLQAKIQNLLEAGSGQVKGIYRTEAAPLACSSDTGIDFLKYSTPSDLLALASDPGQGKSIAEGTRLDIVTQCVVEKIVQQDGTAIALQTSRGVLPLGQAKLILAMGTLPPTTLVRNSFPTIKEAGERFSAHFITSIVARVPKVLLDPKSQFGSLELAANYIAGTVVKNGIAQYDQQYHIQLSSLWDSNPQVNAPTALRYMPDVVATASMAQLLSSEGYVVFVCAVLGELDYKNRKNWFRANKDDGDSTTNSLLQVVENSNDAETWEAMDEATFGILEQVIGASASDCMVEYWHGTPDQGLWSTVRPDKSERRVDALVHESSTLHIGHEGNAPVSVDYRLKESTNVYVTGGALWPQGGSWNPTMTMTALALDLADKLTVERK